MKKFFDIQPHAAEALPADELMLRLQIVETDFSLQPKNPQWHPSFALTSWDDDEAIESTMIKH